MKTNRGDMKTSKIVIETTEDYYDSILVPDVDEYKTIIPTPLWKMPEEWWNGPKVSKIGNLPVSRIGRNSNFVACPSTRNWVEKTIVVPLTTDFELIVDQENDNINYIAAQDRFLTVDPHPEFQYNMYTKNHLNLKFDLRFNLKYRGLVLFTPPHLHKQYFNLPFMTMHGMINTVEHVPLLINTLWDVGKMVDATNKTGKTVAILAGTPMAYLSFPNIEGRVDIEFQVYKHYQRPAGLWRTLRGKFRLP